MNNDLIDTEGFEFFTENEMLRQHCHLLETELAELHSELKESRGKIATLVLMWSGVSRELAKVETELCQTKAALEVAVHENRERATVAPEGQKDDQPAPSPVAFDLKC
jgi:predicted  nucleic acid-binding Zn-ribbon protein